MAKDYVAFREMNIRDKEDAQRYRKLKALGMYGLNDWSYTHSATTDFDAAVDALPEIGPAKRETAEIHKDPDGLGVTVFLPDSAPVRMNGRLFRSMSDAELIQLAERFHAQDGGK